MNLFDVVAVVVLVAAVLAGVQTGALPQVGGIGGAILGLLVVLAGAPWLLDATSGLEPIPRALVVIASVLGSVVIGEALGSAIGRGIASGIGRGVVSRIDRVAGGLLGAAQAILIIWLAGGLLAAGPFPTLGRAATQSAVVRGVDRFLPPPTEVIGQIAGVLDASGLPDVFVGLDPVPQPAVDTPSDPEAQRIGRAAFRSTAKISSRACSVQVNGTGVIVAPGYLVTNAHVVAGASTIRAAIGPDLADAVPVLFDPTLDVAVLYVPRLSGPPMRFAASDPGRGTAAAALGFAGGGSTLTVLPAAVSGAYEATGRDIYDAALVVRPVLELRAAIEPGDSGGPLVLEDGTLGGLVFAESRADPAVGYALTPTEVATRIAPAFGRTGSVDVGRCIA